PPPPVLDAGPPPLPPPGPSGGVSPAVDGGQPTARDAGCGTVDLPDDQGADTNCDGVDGIVGVDVYLSAQSRSDTNGCAPSAPMRTPQAAITLASSRHGHVLAQEGRYA